MYIVTGNGNSGAIFRALKLTRNVHLSFSSGSPEEVISVARTNSLKSMVPLLSRSKMRNRWSTITVGSSFGKIFKYMVCRSAFLKTPDGHSFKKRLYHSLENQFWLWKLQVKVTQKFHVQKQILIFVNFFRKKNYAYVVQRMLMRQYIVKTRVNIEYQIVIVVAKSHGIK